jgi:hypothetical protein
MADALRQTLAADMPGYPIIRAYIDRICARPAFKKASDATGVSNNNGTHVADCLSSAILLQPLCTYGESGLGPFREVD